MVPGNSHSCCAVRARNALEAFAVRAAAVALYNDDAHRARLVEHQLRDLPERASTSGSTSPAIRFAAAHSAAPCAASDGSLVRPTEQAIVQAIARGPALPASTAVGRALDRTR